MALATLSDALPTGTERPTVDALPTGTGQPGLSARLSSLAEGLGGFLADLDPGLLLGADAAALYADFARLERLVVAGKTLLAPRIATSGHWEVAGHRSPASLLATLEGGSASQARRTLETGQRLVELPGCEQAVRLGTLSGPKLTEITRAATLDPASEAQLLAGSDTEPLHVVKERCQRVRADAAAADPEATVARIHARRSLIWWTDPEGAFCFSGTDTAERGARLLARLTPVATRLAHDRRAAATEAAATRPKGAPVPPVDSGAASLADALFLLVTGHRSRRPGARPAEGPGATPSTADPPDQSVPDDTFDPDDPRDVADPCDPDDLVAAVPSATVMVRVDLAALRRGRAAPGELSDIDGLGPVPVPVVASLLDDAFVSLVCTEAGDIRAIAHLGRTINQPLRTALAFRDRCCVVPRCGVPYGLEIDHVHPLEEGGRTELSNLALLCHHHHRMKTYDGWVLTRTGPTDEDPGWTFAPRPPFGQEPDLGLDRPPDPPEPVPRT